MQPQYEVYALRYALHQGRQASENFIAHDDQHSGPMPLAFYLWAIKGNGRTIVVDTGFDEHMATKRGRTFLNAPALLLADIGIEANDVTDVIITHMHYDHSGNLGLFPNARYHIQEAEMAYCTGSAMTFGLLRKPFEVENVKDAIDCLFDDRMVFHDGDADLGGGIRLHKVGGHTKGMQVVSIPTQRGQVVLASDAAHYWVNITRRSPFPIVVDVQDMLAAYGTMERLVDSPDHIIPGHDPLVLQRFPRLAHNPDIALLHLAPTQAPARRDATAGDTTIAIVGMGPRGLSILDQLCQQLAHDSSQAPIRILLFDNKPCGQGSHCAHQHDDLLINTVASQVSIFARDRQLNGHPAPSLTEWARQEGYRRVAGKFQKAQPGMGEAISDHDYLPRKLLGEYLAWAFRQISALFNRNVSLAHITAHVEDIVAGPEGTYRLALGDGTTYTANYAVLATGHGVRKATAADANLQAFAEVARKTNPHAAYFPAPYPVTQLQDIAPGTCVAIQGLGLTAYDVISTLTIARGGRFSGEGRHLVYHPSGREPRILLVSRNCLPFAARGTNQKGLAGSHAAAFFTVAAVQALQQDASARRGSPQLDFEREVLPLIKLEMAYAYRLAERNQNVDSASFAPSQTERDAIDRLLDPLHDQTFEDFQHFARFFREHLEQDLDHAFLGNLSSPLKAAADVLRDTREALRAAVEFGGLTPDSHKIYVDTFVPATNRIAFGPPKQRNAELLALMDAGVVSVTGGPGNQLVLGPDHARFRITNSFKLENFEALADVLIAARLDLYSPLTDQSKLAHTLLANGIARPYLNGGYHPGGLDITPTLQVIDANGKAHEHLWAIGFPVEGPHFYTHALPRPLKDSRFCQDAATCVEQLVQALGEHRSRYLPAVAPGPSGVDGVPARADLETSGAHYPTLADCD